MRTSIKNIDRLTMNFSLQVVRIIWTHWSENYAHTLVKNKIVTNIHQRQLMKLYCMVIKIQYVLHSPKGWTVGRFGRKNLPFE